MPAFRLLEKARRQGDLKTSNRILAVLAFGEGNYLSFYNFIEHRSLLTALSFKANGRYLFNGCVLFSGSGHCLF